MRSLKVNDLWHNWICPCVAFSKVYIITKCYVLGTVHLGIILVNDQLDTQFFFLMFISILYMFRATLCSSPGESIASIQHLVYVTLCRWLSKNMYIQNYIPGLQHDLNRKKVSRSKISKQHENTQKLKKFSEILNSSNKQIKLNSSKTKWTIFKIRSFWISLTGLSVQISWINVLLPEMSMVQMLNIFWCQHYVEIRNWTVMEGKA
jgi:hypothetical protein